MGIGTPDMIECHGSTIEILEETAMILEGTVLKVEQRKGEKDGRRWSYWSAFILDEVVVWEARISDDFKGDFPTPGEVGRWAVRVSAFRRSNGSADLSVALTGVASEVQALRAEMAS